MSFAAPMWLLALVPWAAVVLYLLWGRRRRVNVPFLELWPSQSEGVRVRRRAAPPPIAMALAILATLLALLAGGRPNVNTRWVGPFVTVVVDRGYTMSARAGRATRAAVLLDQVTAVVQPISADRETIAEVFVPEARGPVLRTPAEVPTALDTRELLRRTVRDVCRDAPDRAIVVLTDNSLSSRDDRVIVVPPTTLVRNARIVTIAARETPAAQVMVRVRGGPGFGPAKLRVSSGGQQVDRDVQLPASGERDEFVDLSRLGPTVKAELLIDDDQPADNPAWLAREASWPRIEARVPLPPHVQRMVDVYAKQRPPTEASKRLVIVQSVADLPSDWPGVVLPADFQQAGNEPAAQPVIADHPVTKGVTWADVGKPILSSQPPPSGWTPLVSVGGKVWVAAREQPARAVWVGFDTSPWATSPAFVMFWANVFNWAGAGGERFASYPVGWLDDADWKPLELAAAPAGSPPPEPKLWPGLYQRSDGTLRAINAPDLPIPTPPAQTDWRERLAALAKQSGGQVNLAPALATAALVSLVLATWAWKRRDSTGPLVA